MFGFIVASIPSLSEEEKDRYRSLYCGLCRVLKERYGQLERATLTYDFTFYVMLCDSLHEPVEASSEGRCIMHPTRHQEFVSSPYSDLAADFTIAMAYHKCLDDWRDDKKVRASMAAKFLEGAYAKVQKSMPEICAILESAMTTITAIEADPQASPDAAANEFGSLLGEIFSYQQGFWSEDMRLFGAQLGKFIYLMDSAVDLKEDEKKHRYNPFIGSDLSFEELRTLLATLIGNAAATFEKLPLEQDVHLMRSVLYEGVWQQFNQTYEKELRALGEQAVQNKISQNEKDALE